MIPEKKIKRRNESSFIAIVHTFGQSTSQHGFKFLYLPKRTLLEKYIWVIIILMSIVGIGVYAFLCYNVYTNQPLLTSTDSIHHPIWEYYFPALTICNTNKLSLEKVEKTMKLFHNFSGTEYNTTSFKKDLSHIYQIVNPRALNTSPKLLELQKVLDNNNVTVSKLLELISPDCELLIRCRFKGYTRKCKKLFKKILTVYGYCCSFNYYAIEGGLPSKVSQCGYKSGLTVVMDTRRFDYGAFDLDTTGFQVFVHYPFEYLSWGQEFIVLSQSSANFISIRASSYFTSDTLINYTPAERKCLLPHDRELEMFTQYTYQNCLMQCRMMMLLNQCRCIPFYYNLKNNSYKICNLKDVPCLKRMKLKIINSKNKLEECDCPEDCEYLEFSFSYSGVFLTNNRPLIEPTSIGAGLNLTNHTIITAYYNNLEFIDNKRNSQYDIPSLLALLGGVMSIFNGISLMSLVEFLYFFTVRWFFKNRENKHFEEKNKKVFQVKPPKNKEIFIKSNGKEEKLFTLQWNP